MTMMGTGEIEQKHGLTRLQVFKLAAAGDWPEPAQELARGRLWEESVVDERVEAMLEAGRLRPARVFRKSEDGGEWVDVIQIVPWKYLDEEKMRTWGTAAGQRT